MSTRTRNQPSAALAFTPALPALPALPGLLALLMLVLLLASCRPAEITTYTAPKDPAPAASDMSGMAGGMGDPSMSGMSAMPPGHPPMQGMPDMTMPPGHPPMQNMPGSPGAPGASADGAEAASLTWTAPATWTPKPAGQMLKASYTVPAIPSAASASPDTSDASDTTTSPSAAAAASTSASAPAAFTVSSFPGNVGGIFANVNRWRGQLRLDPIAEADLAANTTTIETTPADAAPFRFTVVDIANPASGQRMIGAMLPLPAGAPTETWFFKLTGPAATVAAQKQNFLDLLQTVKPQQTPQ